MTSGNKKIRERPRESVGCSFFEGNLESKKEVCYDEKQLFFTEGLD